MNKFHSEILQEFIKNKGKSTKHEDERDNIYVGSTKGSYHIKTAIKRQIAKNWAQEHNDFSVQEYTDLLNSLSKGNSHDEISFVGKLLEFFPKLRKQIDPQLLNKWLENVEGWAEVDSICQSNFSTDELLVKWSKWKKLILNLSKSKNVHKRRASLVLLTGPVRHSNDPRLAKLSFLVIDRLKDEKDILITKAISWLLRDLIKYHRDSVEKYLDTNSNELPKIAVRETRRKLLTGKK